jgi:hypothetical protein
MVARSDIAGVKLTVPGATVADILVSSLLRDAIAGDHHARKIVFDRHDGKVPAALESDISEAAALDPEIARRILEAADPESVPAGLEPDTSAEERIGR